MGEFCDLGLNRPATTAQKLIDQFVIKLRMVRHLRMQTDNDIFAKDPT